MSSGPDPGACYRGVEAVRLGYCPHRQITTITPATDTDAVIVYRIILHDKVHAGEDVAKISIAKILDVALREVLAPAETAAWIGKKYKVALMSQDGKIEKPADARHRTRAAVNLHDHGITPRGIIIAGIGQPTLDL